MRRASTTGAPDGARALSSLCDAYWYPLYAFVRRSGKNSHDAEDLVQGFFARVLEKNVLMHADERKGKFRTFLLACLRHYLSDERDRAGAQKRGAGVLSSFDSITAEERYAAEPPDDQTPDILFQRRWALAILEHTLRLVREKYANQGKTEVFEALRPFLGFGVEPEKDYQQVATALGLAVGTVKSEVFRLRHRWRDLLFEEVGRTLDNPTPDDIKAELRELIGAV